MKVDPMESLKRVGGRKIEKLWFHIGPDSRVQSPSNESLVYRVTQNSMGLVPWLRDDRHIPPTGLTLVGLSVTEASTLAR